VPPRFLGVFAHPDDEVFCAGGALARYTSQGAEAMVVSVTRTVFRFSDRREAKEL